MTQVRVGMHGSDRVPDLNIGAGAHPDITSEPWLAEQKQQLQQERNGALLRVHAVVCSKTA